MPATRSNGPPTEASFQPVLMEAFENFKQRHSKQNQDLIHKNRMLLKTISELEKLVTDLRNQNISLSLALSKANRDIKTRGSDPIRTAVAEIVARCQFIHSALDRRHQPDPGHAAEEAQTISNQSQAPISSSTSSDPQLHLLAARERRRTQLVNEPSRLSFINECETIEEQSSQPSTARSGSSSSSSSTSSPSPPLIDRMAHFVSDRSHRRQSLLPNFDPPLFALPSTSNSQEDSSDSEEPDAGSQANLAKLQQQPLPLPPRKKVRAQIFAGAAQKPELVANGGLCDPEMFELPVAGPSQSKFEILESELSCRVDLHQSKLEVSPPTPSMFLTRPPRATRIEQLVPKLKLLPITTTARQMPPAGPSTVDQHVSKLKSVSPSRRRDSGLKKKRQKKKREVLGEEADSEPEAEEVELPPPPTKKRARGASGGETEQMVTSGAEGFGPRRARKEVNYALPSLNKKMRRPEDHVSTLKRASLSLPRGAGGGGTKNGGGGQRSCSAGSIESRSKSPVELPDQEQAKVLQTVQENVLRSKSGGRRHSGSN